MTPPIGHHQRHVPIVKETHQVTLGVAVVQGDVAIHLEHISEKERTREREGDDREGWSEKGGGRSRGERREAKGGVEREVWERGRDGGVGGEREKGGNRKRQRKR